MFALLLAIAPLKLEISTIEKAIEEKATADLYFRLAQARLRDQEPDAAYLDFLHALDLTEPQDSWVLPQLENYFLGKPVENQDSILHAIALANKGDTAGFFDLFFKSYPHFKGSFIDFKTRGIIYLRLSQRTLNKKRYLDLAKMCIEKALELEPRDGSLYRILFDLGDKKELLLEKLAENDVYIHRQDILPFVQKALEMNRKEIAEVIVMKTKQHYSYSRSIEAAEQLLGRER